MISTATIANKIERQLRESGISQRAVSEKAYLKSALKHYGTCMTEIRRVAKQFVEQQTRVIR